jgi:hypothetical protein
MLSLADVKSMVYALTDHGYVCEHPVTEEAVFLTGRPFIDGTLIEMAREIDYRRALNLPHDEQLTELLVAILGSASSR